MCRSSVIWEVKKKKNKWITLNNEIISILEEEYSKNPKASKIDKGKLQVRTECIVCVEVTLSLCCRLTSA